MKFYTVFFAFFLFYGTHVNAHDKITFKNKAAFNTACSENKNCSTFDLGQVTDQASVDVVKNWADGNKAILNLMVEGSIFKLNVLSEKVDKVIYQKLFYQLGVQEFEILEGKEKGIYTMDEFLNLYNL